MTFSDIGIQVKWLWKQTHYRGMKNSFRKVTSATSVHSKVKTCHSKNAGIFPEGGWLGTGRDKLVHASRRDCLDMRIVQTVHDGSLALLPQGSVKGSSQLFAHLSQGKECFIAQYTEFDTLKPFCPLWVNFETFKYHFIEDGCSSKCRPVWKIIFLELAQ